MESILLYSILCFFAFFGVIQFFICIKNEFTKSIDYDIIIPIKNQQDKVEQIVRNVVNSQLYENAVPHIYFVDIGSTDETKFILERACGKSGKYNVLDKEEYIELLLNEDK